MSNPSLDNALAFAEYGFPVFPVWGITDGTCRCPKGAACTSPGKHPIPPDGLKAGTTDSSKLTKMLAAPGSGGNYGIVPAEHVAIIDIDGEDWVAKVKELELPPTLMTLTANGCHLWYRWPDDIPMPTRLHGFVVRSTEHPGYVIGPGSTHQTGFVYKLAHQNGHDIYTMLGRIAPYPAALATQPEGQLTLTMGPGLVPPERVPTGSRHDYLRDRARTLRGGGLTGEPLLQAMLSINARLPEPKTEEEVERAIGDVETKFGEDPLPVDATTVAATTDLIASIGSYRAMHSGTIEYVSPLAAYGAVSLISGPPKSGKSTLISGLMRSREQGTFFLWGDPVPPGPHLLVTEEGGIPLVAKVLGLTELDILDRRSFVMNGLTTLDQLFMVLTVWVQRHEARSLVYIDTLAVWGNIKDENDAMEATRAVIAFGVWAQEHGAAVVLVHHTRKGGGEHGESIRGSSAIFGAVDLSIEFRYEGEMDDTRRKLVMSGRFNSPTTEHLDFDPNTRQYERTFSVPSYDELTKHLPLEASGLDGLTRDDLRGVWGKDPRHDIAKLRRANAIVERVVKVGRVSKTVYFKAPPTLDLTGSVGERMANIFALPEPSDDND